MLRHVTGAALLASLSLALAPAQAAPSCQTP
jgi:hypothetical protein